MEKEKLFKNLSYLVVFIFLANFVANKFHWYYSVWWFDMLMHTLGGFWLGLVFVWYFYKKHISVSLNTSTILQAVGWILLVGVAWELFELFFINYMAENRFDLADTFSDLFFDLLGGLSAVFLNKRNY